jgi:ATP-dependent helicase/nuclease subunit B
MIEESVTISAVLYRQLAGSAFRVAAAEKWVKLSELSLEGKTDRVDTAGEYVRIIDYKTGHIDDKPNAYYTGRKLQLQLYLKGVSTEKKPAGAFYFPAAEKFHTDSQTENFRMVGFFNSDEEAITLHDKEMVTGEKSAFFEGQLDKQTDSGMCGDDFRDFLDYAVLVSRKAEAEMKQGNLTPSPYEDVCGYCALKSLCAFDGLPRVVEGIKCSDIVRLVKREKGE